MNWGYVGCEWCSCFVQFKYPESCLQYEYDRRFPVRGLYYDKLKGCLLKLDFFGSIEPDGCFFGRRKVRCSLSFLFGTHMQNVGSH
jgi:hypothetical protein